jgi:hypothetical protein
MMGAAAFILLKAGRREPKCVRQAEIRLARMLKILPIGRSGGPKPLAKPRGHMRWLWSRALPQDMANRPGIGRYVTWITVLAEKMAQYAARQRRQELWAGISAG